MLWSCAARDVCRSRYWCWGLYGCFFKRNTWIHHLDTPGYSVLSVWLTPVDEAIIYFRAKLQPFSSMLQPFVQLVRQLTDTVRAGANGWVPAHGWVCGR